MQDQNGLFSILDTVDSTNNYAAGRIYAGLAKHGEAWFARDQFAGKGQRGKTWKAAPGENIFLSIIVSPDKAFEPTPFLLSVLTANTCREFLSEVISENVNIKWPNDMYCRDRKTGGILIENIYKGSSWDKAIIGIGINVNQTLFDKSVLNATSLKILTGEIYDPIALAKQLHEELLTAINNISPDQFPGLSQLYNEHLYKRNTTVKLKKDNAVFETKICAVNEYGQLLTKDVMDRSFDVGEVVWVL